MSLQLSTSRLMVCVLFTVLASAAHAQSVAITDISKLVGTGTGLISTSAVLVVPATSDNSFAGVPNTRETLTIANASSTNLVSCGYNNSITLNGAGTFSIPAGQTAFWSWGSAPRSAIWCVAAGASTPLQVAVGT